MGKLEGERPLGTQKHRWDDNIKLDLMKVCCDPGDWIELAEDRAVMNLRVP